MLVSEKFTAEVMLSAPRRSVGIPNCDGTLALHTVSHHVFGDTTVKELKVMDLGSGRSRVIVEDEKIGEALWMPGETSEVLYLKKGEKGVTLVMLADVANPSAEPYQVAELHAPVRGMRLKGVDARVVFAVVGLVGDKGELYNDEAVEKKSTARIYDSPRVRIVRDTAFVPRPWH
jgi:hypothetical protein